MCLLHGAHQAYQVDWEAILSRSAEPFIASVSSWLYPPRGARGPHSSRSGGRRRCRRSSERAAAARARLEPGSAAAGEGCVGHREAAPGRPQCTA